jgi:hypothetical protein
MGASAARPAGEGAISRKIKHVRSKCGINGKMAGRRRLSQSLDSEMDFFAGNLEIQNDAVSQRLDTQKRYRTSWDSRYRA